MQQLNVQRVSFTNYSPVVTPKTLPLAGKSTRRDTHLSNCKGSNLHLFSSTLCKPMTSSSDSLCLCLLLYYFYTSQKSTCTRQHTRLSSSFVTISVNFQQVYPLPFAYLRFCKQWCRPTRSTPFNRKIFIVFALFSLLGFFQTSSSLLGSSSRSHFHQ